MGVAVEPTDSSAYRYWAFISYSSHDKAWADWLHRSIESYGIPSRLINHPTPTGEAAPKRLRPVFRDRAELAASPDLGREIEEALLASRYLIVICSPAAARSKWVNTEIETFQRFGRADRVLAVIVDGEPHAGGERECFPPALLLSEPIAADARKEGDGKDNARLKILAGMLGIGFDALKQREAHRRMRRLQVAVALVSAVAVGFAGLALYAEGQRVKAVKARQQAEGVLSYMLWDLRDPLQAIGRLDILRSAQTLVDDYYRELGVDPNDPNMLRVREASLLNNGVSLEEQGDLPGALSEYRKALEIGESLLASDSGNTQWLSDVALDHSRVGAVVEKQGDLDGALLEYGSALEIRRTLVASVPGNTRWQREESETLTSIGGVLEAQGDLEGALVQYRGALAISEGLLLGDATSLDFQGDAAVAHSRIGHVLLVGGDVAGALAESRAALKIAEGRVSADPANALYKAPLPSLHTSVGDALRLRGDAAGALREYRDAVKVAEVLVSLDPGNAESQLALSVSHARVGNVLLSNGDVAGARREYQASLDVAERLAAADPSSVANQENLYFSRLTMGEVLQRSRDWAGALRQFKGAVGIMERLLEADAGSARWQLDLRQAQDYVTITTALQGAR